MQAIIKSLSHYCKTQTEFRATLFCMPWDNHFNTLYFTVYTYRVEMCDLLT